MEYGYMLFRKNGASCFAFISSLCLANITMAENFPALPETDGAVDIPAQKSPYYGERTIKVYLYYPGNSIKNVNEKTGLFLSLHNWGGTNSRGTPDPLVLSSRYNTVAICVDYLQSGVSMPTKEGHPYDFGYLQALDALRALYYVYNGLSEKGIAFDKSRLYCTGGSGGGNVTLMSNKFAPRTFACIMDLSGMASLSDDIAFNLPGGSKLNACYSNDPSNKNYLRKDDQEIRDTGNKAHLAEMKKLGNHAKIVISHGVDDSSCLASDKKRVFENMLASGLDAEAHFITKENVDGTLIKDSGHAVGNRTDLLIHFANKYFSPSSAEMKKNTGKCDFELRDEKVKYKTANGSFVISYAKGYPEGKFISDK